MKHRWLLIFSLFVFLLTFSRKVTATSEIRIEYYFQQSNDEYLFDESVDAHYDPILTPNDYPTFEGFQFFKKEMVQVNHYKLYYDKTYFIIIDGNGGKTADGKEREIIQTVKHGDLFEFDIHQYQDLFTKSGYELTGFIRNFGNKTVVKEDIIINCMWNTEIRYTFVVGNKEYPLYQVIKEEILFPNIFTHELFLGWFDEAGKQVTKGDLVATTTSKRIYGKYLSDFITVSKNEVRVQKNDQLEVLYLVDSTNQVVTLTENANDYLFLGLISNHKYKLHVKINGIKSEMDVKTKEEGLFIFKYENNIIYNPAFQYYLGEADYLSGKEMIPSATMIPYHSDLIVAYRGVKIEEMIEIKNKDFDTPTISAGAVKIKLENQEAEYYFFPASNYSEKREDFLTFYHLSPNTNYCFIYKHSDGSYRIKEFTTFPLTMEIYDQKIILYGMLGYRVKLGTQLYEPNEKGEIVLEKLESNQKYAIIMIHNELEYLVYLHTTHFITDFSQYQNFEVTHHAIHLKDLPKGYKFSINKAKWYTPIESQLAIFGLEANTTYTIYCKALNTDTEFEFIVFQTKKIPTHLVPKPTEKPKVLEINSTYIKFTFNPNYEYSVDQIHWYTGGEIKNLERYCSYKLYVRIKETQKLEASFFVIYLEFMTHAEVPSIHSFVDLYYTDIHLSFKILPGYRYYFNGELVTQLYKFEANNLDNLTQCILKVERIMDSLSFEVQINLRKKGQLNQEERQIEILKTHSSIQVMNAKADLIVIIYDKNQQISKKRMDKDVLIISDLNGNCYYQIYILKDWDETYFYEEEFILEIYIPGDIAKEIQEYLLENKKVQNKQTEKLILEYVSKTHQVQSQEDYITLVKEIKVKIDKIYINQYYLIIGIPILVFGLSCIWLFLRRKNIKSQYI